MRTVEEILAEAERDRMPVEEPYDEIEQILLRNEDISRNLFNISVNNKRKLFPNVHTVAEAREKAKEMNKIFVHFVYFMFGTEKAENAFMESLANLQCTPKPRSATSKFVKALTPKK